MFTRAVQTTSSSEWDSKKRKSNCYLFFTSNDNSLWKKIQSRNGKKANAFTWLSSKTCGSPHPTRYAKGSIYRVVQKDVSILLSLSFYIQWTQTSVFQVNYGERYKVLFPSSKRWGSKMFHAAEGQNCRGLFCDEIGCPNSTAILEGHSRQ